MDGATRSRGVGRSRGTVAGREEAAVHGAVAAEPPGQHSHVRIHPKKYSQRGERGRSETAGRGGQRGAAQGVELMHKGAMPGYIRAGIKHYGVRQMWARVALLSYLASTRGTVAEKDDE